MTFVVLDHNMIWFLAADVTRSHVVQFITPYSYVYFIVIPFITKNGITDGLRSELRGETETVMRITHKPVRQWMYTLYVFEHLYFH